MTFLLTPRAERDLEEIWLYSARTWSVVQAEAYTGEIIDAFERLGSEARQGRRVEGFPSYRQYLVGRHVIYFREVDAGVLVIRVLHQSMDPERHM
ncbi:type II toxin-antitoxin system RelE/ParE family toxin [Thalassococcus profundi]|uniref:type II toxin-antitoxin system RelE/ParE family toxin n=1 Tax=Thalassococcus profundi TaxID=2282382 RepID=UPI0040580233